MEVTELLTPKVKMIEVNGNQCFRFVDPNTDEIMLVYSLIMTTKRITFDILQQAEWLRYRGHDDGYYWKFVASNGYEVISRSRMDIQTERVWMLGGEDDDRSVRSGTMPVSHQEKVHQLYQEFNKAILEWAESRLRIRYPE